MLTSVMALLGAVGAVPADTVPLYDNLGSHHYAITTRVPLAQRYFDQGLRLYYAFNHAEAIRAFREAERLDPSCAMCFWGEALAFGPNINLPMDSAAGAAAHAAIVEAVRLGGGNARERELIEALATRYASPPPADRAGLDSAYARAIVEVARRYPSDHEAAVLAAEAAMDLRPWSYWTREGELEPGMADALATLERVVAEAPGHPGACHFYIHAVEAVHPERAVACAERLAGAMPGAGHLVHMPGHIYIRVGRYVDAIVANQHAVHADETYIRDQQPGVGIYTAGYYPHNYDFMAFAASMAGQQARAIEAADKLAAIDTPEVMREPGMAFTQHHATRRLQVRIRFGRWQEILATPAPPSDLPHAKAMWNYARGRALVATGKIPAAHAELEAVRAAIGDPRLQGLRLEFNESPAILTIAAEVLAGRIASAERRHQQAVHHLELAVAAEDALTYGEPPDWTIPARQDLAAVLLAAERPADAERALREDLAHFPNNGWSLAALMAALESQGRGEEVGAVETALRRAWRDADVPAPVVR